MPPAYLIIHLCCCSASLCAVGDHKQWGPAWGLRALRLKAKDGQCQNHPPWGFTDLHIQLLAGLGGGCELPSPTGHLDPHLPDCTGLMPGARCHEGLVAAPVHGTGQKKRGFIKPAAGHSNTSTKRQAQGREAGRGICSLLSALGLRRLERNQPACRAGDVPRVCPHATTQCHCPFADVQGHPPGHHPLAAR